MATAKKKAVKKVSKGTTKKKTAKAVCCKVGSMAPR